MRKIFRFKRKRKLRSEEDRIKSLFETYFDGCYGVEPKYGVSSTFRMGVCKLEFDEKKNTLTVHLRRPGLLIGVRGHIINDLEAYLECSIKIKEVTKF
jgi:ribosomal protein S3